MVVEKLGYYVYRLVDPQDGATLYVGKGVGERILSHEREAKQLLTKQSRKLDRLREMHNAGRGPKLVIHRHALTEKEAFEIEAALIDAYPDALNEVWGQGSSERGAQTIEELVGKYGNEKAVIAERVVLINLRREWHRMLPSQPDKLYERTRRYWVCNPGKHNPDFALAVAHGIIRAGYKIANWEAYDLTTERLDATRIGTNSDRKRKLRWGFVGTPAPEMEKYVGKTVAQGPQNPIQYRNC